MLFILRYSDHSVERQRELRHWYFANGLLHSQLVDPTLMDTVARTLTVNQKVPMAGQENQDFPEFVVDADSRPVTVERVVDLMVTPAGWMLTKSGAWPGPGAAPAPSVERSLTLR